MNKSELYGREVLYTLNSRILDQDKKLIPDNDKKWEEGKFLQFGITWGQENCGEQLWGITHITSAIIETQNGEILNLNTWQVKFKIPQGNLSFSEISEIAENRVFLG